MKRLFLTLIAVIFAFTAWNCHDNNNKTSRNLTVSTTTISGAPASLATVVAVANNPTSDIIIQSGALTAGGGFSITLPGTLDQSFLRLFYPTSGDIPAGVEISDPDARYVPVFFRCNDSGGEQIGWLTNEKTTLTTVTEVLYWYFDRDITIRGTYTDLQEITLDLTLRKGWNKISVFTNAEENTVLLTCPLPTGTSADWIFNFETQQAVVLTDVAFIGDATDLASTVAVSDEQFDLAIANGVYTAGSNVFSIVLPAVVDDPDAFRTFNGDIPSGLIITDIEARFFILQFTGRNSDGDNINDLFNRTVSGDITTGLYYFYFDRDVTLMGVESSGSSSFIYNLRFRAGWNKILVVSDTANSTEIYTMPIPLGTPDVGWIFGNPPTTVNQFLGI